MKYDFNKAFPYPVLTDYSDDFMDSAFQASADLTIDDGQVSVESIFQLSEENIIRLIDEKKAAYALLVTCNSTYFRKLFIAEKNEIHETLDNGRLHGKVELRPYVVITKDVLGFHSSNINPEYSDSRFDYPKGAVIALDQPVIYYIDQEDFKVFGSVVRLRADKNCKDDFRYTIEGDHIVISVSPAIKKMIDVSIFDAQKKEFIILGIILPVLIDILSTIQQNPEEYKDKKWFRSLDMRLSERGFELSENSPVFRIAQDILGYPLGRVQFKDSSKGEDI